MTRKHEHDGGFDHAETVDAYPTLSNTDLDRIDAQRRQRRQHRALRAVAVPAGAVILLAAVGVIGWRVTIYDSTHQATASIPDARPPSAGVLFGGGLCGAGGDLVGNGIAAGGVAGVDGAAVLAAFG